MAQNSDKTAVKPRGRPFKKGQSGNPGGRPTLPKEFSNLAKRKSMTALKFLTDLIDDDKAKINERIKAAEIIIAYGYGKPTQAIDLSAGQDNKGLEITVKYE